MIAALTAVLVFAGMASTGAALDVPPEGRLIVNERAKGGGGGDNVSVLRVRALASGEVVFARRFDGPIRVDRSLRRGRYRIASFTRSCREDCSDLGPAENRCEERLHMLGGIDRITIVTSPIDPCRMRVRDHYCPNTEFPGFNAKELIGMRVKRAGMIARRHDCIVRVVKRDGEPIVGTDDYRNDRINVAVTNERIVRITGIG